MIKLPDMPYIILIVCLAVAIVLQILTGGIPFYLLSFPVNLILAMIWTVVMLSLWKSCRKSLFVEFMLSRAATLSSVALFLIFCLVVGITGNRGLTDSWISAVLMLYMQTVLLFVILRGWRAPTATGARLGAVRWRFLLNHTGLLLALASAFWGAPDSLTLRLQVFPDMPEREVYDMDGRRYVLPYEIELKDFTVSHYANGTPSMFEAAVIIDGEPVTLRVNEPYARSFGEDIYLSGYGGVDQVGKNGCVLQIVREPWKYSALAGIAMMLSGALLLFVGGPRRRNDDE